uniref:Large ribosomal subunit protein bL17m n=1 Tax=Wuchereria bancrofti TaxID=6293 RepID=A0A1I8EK26_WUCBA
MSNTSESSATLKGILKEAEQPTIGSLQVTKLYKSVCDKFFPKVLLSNGMSASRTVTWLPRIPKAVKIGHIPQRLKSPRLDFQRARLEILRRMCSTLFREERAEFRFHRAVELRPYVERLLQFGILRGSEDPYTKEMVDWWIMDGDIREKFFEVYVPRFREKEGPFTSLYFIQDDPSEGHFHRGVIELNGMKKKSDCSNPYPPIVIEQMDYSHNLLNVLLKNAIYQQMSNLQTQHASAK